MANKKLPKSDGEIFDNIDNLSSDIEALAETTQKQLEKKILAGYQKKGRRVLLSELTLYLDNQSRKLRTLTERAFSTIIKQTKSNISSKYDIELTNTELKTLAENQGYVLDNITANDLKLQADLKSMLLQNIGKEITTVQVVRSLTKLYPAYASQIGTIVNTSLVRMYKDADWTVESEIFEYFQYVGPNDGVTRPYCKSHVGKVYTRAEAEAIQAEIQTFYNCRHKLVGITKQQYDKLS